ncbi:MAG: hypothetical protein C0597_04325, partial [Marinilabiliales bacterium]
MTYLYKKLIQLLNLDMQFKATQKVPETAVYLIIWMVIFIMPVLITTSNTGHFDKQVVVGWARMVPFVLIFIINTVWLLPLLFFKGKTGLYVLSVVILSFLLVYIWEIIFPLLQDVINGNQIKEFNPQHLGPAGNRPRLPNQPPMRPGQRPPMSDFPPQQPRNRMLSIIN